MRHLIMVTAVMSVLLALQAWAGQYDLVHLTEGSPVWRDVLEVDNPGSSAQEFGVALFAEGAPVFNSTFTVPPLSSRNVELAGLAAQASCGIVTSPGQDLVFRLVYVNRSGMGSAGLALQDTRAAKLGLVFSDPFSVDWKGMAVKNTSREQALVSLYALDNGSVVARNEKMLAPQTRMVGFVETFFPTLDPAGVSQVVAASDGAVLSGLTITGAGGGALAFAALPAPGFSPAPFADRVALEPVVSGLDSPLYVISAEDGSGRLFVVEKKGRIRIVTGNSLIQTPFLDITARVGSSGGEQGLLCVAFPPEFPAKDYFYVNYTAADGTSRVSRFFVQPGNANRADPQSEEVLLRIDQPFANHNGGQLAFGPEGFLYIGTGDGGGGGDPEENAQDGSTLLGKILRIDVEAGVSPYRIPSDNPFVTDAGVEDEIWAMGLRNPWRFSFDRVTGELFIGDVGQRSWEEVNRVESSSGGGNFGWDIVEGDACFEPSTGCESRLPANYRAPVHTYSHELGNAVTGGYVYRGQAHPALRGVYVYGDFGSGRIWGLAPGGEGLENRLLLDSGQRISSFGQDQAGELYLCGFTSGTLFRIVVP